MWPRAWMSCGASSGCVGYLRGAPAARLRGAVVRRPLQLLDVVFAALAVEVARRVPDAVSCVPWVLGLKVLDAPELEVLSVGYEVLDFLDMPFWHVPLVQLLLQGRYFELLEWAAMHLSGRSPREADDLRTAEAVLSLQVPLLPVRVLQVVHVVLLERGGVDLRDLAQLLLPPSDGLVQREPAVLEEGPQLQPAQVLQVFLLLALLLHDAPHAGRERAREHLLEVVQAQLLAQLVGGRLRGHQQLHTMLLQLAQETTDSKICERRGQALEGDVEAANQAVLEVLGDDHLHGVARHVRHAVLHDDPPGRDQVRCQLVERHLEEGAVQLGRSGVRPPDLGTRCSKLQVAQVHASFLCLELLILDPGGCQVGLSGFRAQRLEAEHEEPLFVLHEPFTCLPCLAECQPHGVVGDGVPADEVGLERGEVLRVGRVGVGEGQARINELFLHLPFQLPHVLEAHVKGTEPVEDMQELQSITCVFLKLTYSHLHGRRVRVEGEAKVICCKSIESLRLAREARARGSDLLHRPCGRSVGRGAERATSANA
mmetsp:Transcript_18313/g.51856  ORF Transcript_18313/g.51856 Transcript_18313/m.51856 type:complete len:541 (+) Transcript_18313:99-1721(+)